jgi:uncharacterized protein (DUF1330 family)
VELVGCVCRECLRNGFFVRGGNYETLEGDWHLHRLILLEIPSVEQARRWYQSDEYAPVKDIRLKTANTQVILAQGNS